MGKPLDNRNVEYAYRYCEQRYFNLFDVVEQKYFHSVAIFYELLDSDRVKIGTTNVTHTTDKFEEMETIQSANARIDNVIEDWVSADKNSLSGFQL